MRKFEEVREKFRKFPNVETKLPQRATAGSAGYDFYSKEAVVIPPGESHMFYLDICVMMFTDNVLHIYPRSGNGVKYGITIKNTTGVIDPDYYHNPDNDGNIGICLENRGSEPFVVNVGDRIAQGVFTRFYITDDDRFLKGYRNEGRKGGYGSTGSADNGQ